MTIGTEHEYSINDTHFTALPVSDQILKSICGSFESEILFGDVKLGKELQKTVLEFIPRAPASGPAELESMLTQGIRKFYQIFPGQYHLLGLGMHPTLTPGRTAVWDHDEGEYYEAYDRLFNIRQHGWLNIQALQVNLSYAGEKDLLMQYNRIRTLLPYLIALTASSPMVEGRLTGKMDNRLIYYRENQKEIPQICNGIIPARIRSVAEYREAQEQIFSALRARDAGILCEEWLNSSGLIIRFSRGCLEIKAPDEQECIRSDMAVAALVTALLRCMALPVESDQDALLALTETAIEKGTAGLGPELETLYRRAWQAATAEERQYLPVIESRIANGSLAEQIAERYRSENAIGPILADMAHCLRVNTPYGVK
ncbi:glutamate-cysteine ligase family protein [Methanoregula sp.]|uniref:glutamate-cysteine ligase family protein n=1 Tax=Methanoregula sp. TaxID=2052170 RepID=UPI003BB14BCB